ncbi:MAG: TIM barrel protein [Burkholderiaceae bacterium]|nr:TIM barrel protein [Burkholderiaceae bacterium]
MNIRLSANLGFLWADLPLMRRIEKAAEAGFKAIELHWPFDTPAADVRAACLAHDLTLLSVNTPQGDVASGDAGLAAQIGREAQFKSAFEMTLAWAREAGASKIHVLPGMASPNKSEAARRTFVANLQWAADLAAREGVTILLEALNHRDKPGYFYHTQAESNSIRVETGRDNIKLMFDVYHVGVTEGDVLVKLEHYLPVIGHIQIAAVPSRREPDEGEIRYEAVFKRLQELGFSGWIGCEYKPRDNVEAGLAWVQAMGLHLG